ncbi:ATPase, T2SS/T4P/T4SS family [Paenibacillus crassostreae]|uniref:Pilus assembly protein CpaF n=1 Tax=Paenibacillus crassostreae TaxID=1763538 RepID=A0A162KVS5_9BACL|nr:ATPase, T2SS/T4P/T4SS family [Paenibacillus crassostreae]AOZ91107.1 pilus assembly protein CpaF [Paenibacillus crassostreae]OAB74733.1 pilus assembly protein CpaF [Paenibacillus crassostreae]
MSLGYIINIAFILLILFLVGVVIFFKLTDKRKQQRDPHELDKKYTIGGMIEYIRFAFDDMTKTNLEHLGLSEEEYIRRTNQMLQLKQSLKGSTYGDLQDKRYVQETMFDLFLNNYSLNEENINWVIPFNNKKDLTHQDKFEIIIHHYKKKHRFDALTEFIESHNLANLKNVHEDANSESYIITPEEIDDAYRKEGIVPSFEDKLYIIVQRIYQQFKGFSVIDEIRDMRIDGVSGGVSGTPISQLAPDDGMIHLAEQMNRNTRMMAHDSIWIFYKGKSIHLSFLTFGSESELIRVCQNIYKYKNPGQLSEHNGYKVNEMKDGSRIVVVRPPFSESWAFFVRKFDTQSATLEQLINPNIVNRELSIKLLSFLIKGGRVTAITGSQGSGKTTLLMALVNYINASYTLRVQEMSFELHLRKIYKWRNILTIRETDTISGQEGLDLQKKTDGTVNILGEVATDPVAAWMIQITQVASLFTIFTHHAKTFPNLIYSLRNSLLKTNIFNDEKIAEEEVVRVINFNIHLTKDPDGTRTISRVTECIPMKHESLKIDFESINNPEERTQAFFQATTEYYNRSMDRKVFDESNIIVYQNGEYIAVNPISERNTIEMLELMSPSDQEEFHEFIKEFWG